MFDKTVILAQARRFESFYLYDQRSLLEQIQRLQEALPWAAFLYSVKANPHSRVLETVFGQDLGADAASLGEVRLARDKGLEPARIYYSAPGKSRGDIAGALGQCVLIADSLDEAGRIQALAEARGITADIGLRLNPNFTLTGNRGAPGKFGVDEEQFWERLPWLKGLSHVHLVGIHVHLKSQELDCGVLIRYYEKMFALAARVAERLQRPLEFLNLGSGLGIPFGADDTVLDVASLGAGVAAAVKRFRGKYPSTRLLIETGRYVAGKAGVYVTHVMDVKTSRGIRYALLANTLNGFARPSLAQLAALSADGEKPLKQQEPLLTCRHPFALHVLTDETETEPVTLMGNLCTSADLVAQGEVLPRLKEGDVVVFTNAGCYAAALSPMQFASMTPPAQLFLTRVGQVLES